MIQKSVFLPICAALLLSACEGQDLLGPAPPPAPPVGAKEACVSTCKLSYDECLIKCQINIGKSCECEQLLKTCYQTCLP